MSEFSDFDDEEGVDEPVLSDNDQDEKEEEEVCRNWKYCTCLFELSLIQKLY